MPGTATFHDVVADVLGRRPDLIDNPDVIRAGLEEAYQRFNSLEGPDTSFDFMRVWDTGRAWLDVQELP